MARSDFAFMFHAFALIILRLLLLRRFMARSDFAFMFHAFALIFYVRTWMWHTTPAAAGLPGAQGFGWFFR